ncbi:MAG TPA: hypothetical protein PLS00_00250 [Niabella sp.]|jgi:hypothetical protein|nr:hypothetical protein [Niabella sp.]
MLETTHKAGSICSCTTGYALYVGIPTSAAILAALHFYQILFARKPKSPV